MIHLTKDGNHCTFKLQPGAERIETKLEIAGFQPNSFTTVVTYLSDRSAWQMQADLVKQGWTLA